MKKLFFSLLVTGFVLASGMTVWAQTDLSKYGCKNFLGRQGESMCPTAEGYNACMAALKEGKVTFCVQSGLPESAARRATAIEARQKLIQHNCKETSPLSFQCPDASYSSNAWLECTAYKNGGAIGACSKRKNLLMDYADRIDAQLKGHSFGYAYVVAKKGEISIERSGGSARLKQDAPAMDMSATVKYSLASVSKNITASALLKLLNEKNLSVDAKIKAYLPYNWKPGVGIDTLTFRDLLTHKSGIRCEGRINYQGLRQVIEKGINVNDKTMGCSGTNCAAFAVGEKSIGCYSNTNYALMRVLIPVILGKIAKPQLSTLSQEQTDNENAILAANVYIDYVNKNVFAKATLPAMACKPTDGTKQGLTYKYAVPNSNGGDFGDQTLVCGSQGWFMSARQLSSYFFALNNTDLIVPSKIAEQMRNELFGYTNESEFDSPFGKIKRWWHTGFHPASMNPGEINTLVMRFSNGVEIALIINSDLSPGSFNYGDAVTNAMATALNTK